MPSNRLLGHVTLPLIGFLLGATLWLLLVDGGAPQPAVAVSEPSSAGDIQGEDPAWSHWSNINTIFLFGDANSDTFFDPLDATQPTAHSPLGNSRRLADTLQATQPTKWIQHVASSQAAPGRKIYNLARSGALIERYAYGPHPAGVLRAAQDASGMLVEDVHLHEQVDRFLTLYTPGLWRETHASWTSTGTLFAVWLGANDIIEAAQHDAGMATTPLYASFLASLERLYLAGARNFLLLNTPPLERNTQSPPDTKADVRILNQHLVRACITLLRRHASVTLFLYDAHSLFSAAIDSPQAFTETADLFYRDRHCDSYARGLPDSPDTLRDCIQPRDRYFWLSRANVSAPVHRLLAHHVVADCFGDAKPTGRCSNGLTIIL